MTPCAHCPVDPPSDCRAARTGLTRVCDLCDPAHPDYAPGFAAQLAGASGCPPAGAATPKADKPRLTFDQLAAMKASGGPPPRRH